MLLRQESHNAAGWGVRRAWERSLPSNVRTAPMPSLLANHVGRSLMSAMIFEPRDHIVLRYMAERGALEGEPAPVDAIVDYGYAKGYHIEEMKGAFVLADAKGWIGVAGRHVYLTRIGYIVPHPANDNAA